MMFEVRICTTVPIILPVYIRSFEQFGLSEQHISYLRGYSQDSHVHEQLTNRLFDVIYIDGGHRYEQVI